MLDGLPIDHNSVVLKNHSLPSDTIDTKWIADAACEEAPRQRIGGEALTMADAVFTSPEFKAKPERLGDDVANPIPMDGASPAPCAKSHPLCCLRIQRKRQLERHEQCQ